MHPFDVPLDQPIEGLPAVADDHGPADAGGREQETDDHEEQGPAEQVDAADGLAEEAKDRQDAGDDVEHDGNHGRNVPAQRPLDPAQLRRTLTSWCDGLVTFDDRALGLQQVLMAEAALGDVEQELTDTLAAEMPKAWVETPAGVLKRDSRGGHSSWDADAIWPDALAEARRRAADPATGELSPEAERGAQAMLAVVKEILSSPSFRVGALQKIGVDPDEVRATAPRRKIVRFA
jgi:hypothetical protein